MSNVMAEWVAKAENDYQAELDLAKRRKNPLPDNIVYECAQCAEKYLKAFLIRSNEPFRYRHDLPELNTRCQKVDQGFRLIDGPLIILNQWASEIRYPGVSATVNDAKKAVEAIKQVRKFVRARLGLK